MPGPKKKAKKKLSVYNDIIRSKFFANKYKDLFDKVERYCMFLGYPRSSHSLIGSILDAHPHMLIAHEQDVLKYPKYNMSKNEIFWLLMKNSERFTKKGRNWSGYSYRVEGQYQGSYRELQVIGDKRGGNSTRRIKRKPEVLKQLKEIIDIPFRIIHVYRNPFDNISTIAYRHCHKNASLVTKDLLKSKTDEYFGMADGVLKAKEDSHEKEWMDLKVEDFIEKTEEKLRELCEFLGVEKDEKYIEGASSIVYENPRKSRYEVEWDEESKTYVLEYMKGYDHLKEYGFDK
ncbi:MAG: sulfotransferase [Flavobacteriales bacterium]